MGIKVRFRIPSSEQLLPVGIAILGHLVLLIALALTAFAEGGGLGTLGPSMMVRLSGPTGRAPRAGGGPRAESRPAPRPPAPEPAPAKKPSVRAPVQEPEARNVTDRPRGTTAQPEELPTQKPKPGPGTAGEKSGGSGTDETPPGAAGHGAGAGGPGFPGAPEGPISGGIAGVGLDEPGIGDWYVGLVVNRLQDAWRDRPVLPAGLEGRRAVVGFVIQKDGRVTDVTVHSASGYGPLDASALRAVSSLQQLPPLPPVYRKEQLRARFIFELLPSEN